MRVYGTTYNRVVLRLIYIQKEELTRGVFLVLRRRVKTMSSTHTQQILIRCLRQRWRIKNSGSLLSTSRRLFSSPSFAVVDHSKAYEEAMKGRHGQQLELAKLDGVGKDDPVDHHIEAMEIFELKNSTETIMAEDNLNEDGTVEAEYTEKGTNNEISEEDEEEEEEEENDSDDDDYNEEEDDEDDFYNNDGSVPYSKSQLATFKAGGPAGGLFAIIEMPGTQHKVTVDDVIVSNILKPLSDYPIGSIIECSDNILLMGSSHQTIVGLPKVTGGALVKLMVEEITLDKKVVIFKKRRRKNSQRKNGFRRQVMMLRVLDIQFPTTNTNNEYAPRVAPDTEYTKPTIGAGGGKVQEECA